MSGYLQFYAQQIVKLQRDLAARDAELAAIAQHVGGGAFYRDERGGRLPMRDQVWQHIAELMQQLATANAELAQKESALLTAATNLHMAETELARVREQADKFKWQVRDTCQRAEKAEAERDALKQDAERYRKCRRNGGFYFSTERMSDAEIDARVDELPDYQCLIESGELGAAIRRGE